MKLSALTRTAALLAAIASFAGCNKLGASGPESFPDFAQSRKFTFAGADQFVRQAAANVGPVVGKRGDETIKLKVIESIGQEDAARYIEDQGEVLDHLFAPQLPPYPEFLTRQTGCPDAFHPKPTEVPNGKAYLLWANERLGYGVCSTEMAARRAGLGYFYCATNKRLVKLEYFVPASEPETKVATLLQSFKCL